MLPLLTLLFPAINMVMIMSSLSPLQWKSLAEYAVASGCYCSPDSRSASLTMTPSMQVSLSLWVQRWQRTPFPLGCMLAFLSRYFAYYLYTPACRESLCGLLAWPLALGLPYFPYCVSSNFLL